MSLSAAFACAFVYWILHVLDPYMLSWQCLNRPIVIAPIVGLVLGDLHTGLVMGASLEAIFMGISAVGGSIPSDALSASVISTAYAITIGGDNAMETGLALSLSIGTVMATFNNMLMTVWSAMAPFWERLALQCKPKKFMTTSLIFNLIAAIPPTIVIFLGVAYGIDGLNNAIAACPAWVLTGLAAAGSMMTAIGFGILLSMIWSAQICVFYFIGFVLAKSLELSSLGIAIIGAGIAITIFFIEKQIIEFRKSVASLGGNEKDVPMPANSEEDFF